MVVRCWPFRSWPLAWWYRMKRFEGSCIWWAKCCAGLRWHIGLVGSSRLRQGWKPPSNMVLQPVSSNCFALRYPRCKTRHGHLMYNIIIYIYIILYACISVFCAIIPVCPLIYIIIYNIFSHVARHILTYYILKYMLPRSATYSENLLQCFLTFFGNFSCDVFWDFIWHTFRCF